MTARDDFDINLIVSVVQNGGFFDRGTLGCETKFYKCRFFGWLLGRVCLVC